MSSDNKESSQIFLVGMIMSMFCWGLSWTSGKILAGYGPAPNITLYRFVITFVSLLLILLFTKEKLQMKKQGMKDLIGAAVFMVIYTNLFFLGLSNGNAGAGGVLVTSLNPIISYGIMLIYTRRKPKGFEAAGLFIGIIAGSIPLRVWDNWQNLFSPGNIYFLLASFTWALLSLFTARSSRHGSPVAFSLWMYGISALIMLLIAGYQENVIIFKKSDLSFWGNLFFSSTITTSVATTFYFVATARLGASKASSFIFLVPFSAALGAWLFLHEVPRPHTIAGGMLGIIAVYLLNRK